MARYVVPYLASSPSKNNQSAVDGCSGGLTGAADVAPPVVAFSFAAAGAGVSFAGSSSAEVVVEFSGGGCSEFVRSAGVEVAGELTEIGSAAEAAAPKIAMKSASVTQTEPTQS